MFEENILYVDSREPPKIASILEKEGVKFEITALEIGDFVCGNVCIERKTISDFASSMKSGHLQKQLLQMQENFKRNYVIIVGHYKDLAFQGTAQYSQWLVNNHLGALASVSVRYNVKIIEVDNDTQLAKILKYIFQKSFDRKVPSIIDTELMSVRGKMTASDISMLMIHCIPKVGLDRAQLLRKHLEVQIIRKDGGQITKDFLTNIEGVGNRTAEEILNFKDQMKRCDHAPNIKDDGICEKCRFLDDCEKEMS